MRRPLFSLVMACLSVSGFAFGDSPDRELVDSGIRLRREHRDAEALEVFRRALELRDSPRTRAQVALAEHALGQWVVAERDLLAALSDPDDPWIASHQSTLKGALDAIQKRLGTLTVRANVDGAEVWLDESKIAELPAAALRVPAGALHLEVRAKGYVTSRRTMEIAAGTTAVEDIELAVEEPAEERRPSPAEVSLGPPSPSSAAAPEKARPADRATGGAARDTRRAMAWGALGAAGAFLGEALVAQMIREDRAARYNDDSACLRGSLSRDQSCGTYRGQAEAAQVFANIGYVAAGALAVSSVVLFWSSRPEPPRKGARLWIDPGPWGVQLGVKGEL